MSKTPQELQAEIRAARDDMAAGIRGLTSEIHPTVIRQRAVQHTKDAAMSSLKTIKELVVDDAGIRWDRIGAVAMATAGLVVVIEVSKGLHHLFHRH